MRRTPESRITKFTKVALSASMGAAAFSGAVLNSKPHTVNYNTATSAKAPEVKLPTFVELTTEFEELHLAWGEGPGQPEDGIAATYVFPDGRIGNFIIESIAKIEAPRKYMPKPNEVDHIAVVLYPKGTKKSRIGIDAVPQYSNLITNNMDTDGNTEKHVVDAQISESGITHPDYSFAPNSQNSYFLDVDGSHIHIQIGNSAMKEIINQTKANIALGEMENQALMTGIDAEQHRDLPSSLPRPKV